MPGFDLRSLKVRLLLLAAVSIGMTMVVAGTALVVMFERHIQRRIGQELAVRWTDIAGSIAVGAAGRVAFTRPLTDPRYGQPLSGAYWQIAGPGETLRSRSLWDNAFAAADGADPAPYEVEGPEDSELYVVSRRVTLGDGAARAPYVISVALDHRDIHVLSDAYEQDLFKALAIIAAVLFAGAWLQAVVGLAPLRQLRRSIEQIRTGLTSRLGGGFATEVQPLVDDLDHMLDRNDLLLRKARDRAGALAHGLKTPLTILGLEAQRLEAGGDGTAARVLREQLEMIRRHVERELMRSRVHGTAIGGSALGAAAPADLGLMARRLVDLVRRMPRADALDFVVDVPERVRVPMDQADLGEVIGNLLDNARKWADTRVDIAAETAGGHVVVTVADDGPGPDAPAGATGRNVDGTGLGLAIVSDILGEYAIEGALTRENGRTIYRFAVPVPVARAGERRALPTALDGLSPQPAE